MWRFPWLRVLFVRLVYEASVQVNFKPIYTPHLHLLFILHCSSYLTPPPSPSPKPLHPSLLTHSPFTAFPTLLLPPHPSPKPLSLSRHPFTLTPHQHPCPSSLTLTPHQHPCPSPLTPHQHPCPSPLTPHQYPCPSPLTLHPLTLHHSPEPLCGLMLTPTLWQCCPLL